MSNKEVFFKGISTQTLITLVMGIMEVFVFSMMSRFLSKSEFGYFAALTGIITVCTSITEAGLGAAIIQKKDAQTSFVATVFSLSWLMGIVGTLLIFVFAPVISLVIADETLTTPLRIMSVNIFFACILSVKRSLLIKKLDFKKVGMYNISAYSLSAAIGITLAYLGFGLYAVIAVSVLNLFFFNILLYCRRGEVPKFAFDRSQISSIFSFGGWLTAGVIVNNLTQQMDRLFLSKWLSVTALGSYNRPAGFVSNITTRINGIFDTVLFPMLSKAQDDEKKIKTVFVKAVKLLNSFSVVLFAIFFFNAELIISIFFGSNWINLVPVMQIVSIYVIFNIDSRLVDCYFRSLAMVDLGFKLRVCSALITFIGLYIGSEFDILGVAIGLVVSNILTVFLKVSFLSRRLKISIISVFASMFLACKPILLLGLIGYVNLLFFNHGIVQQIVFATLYAFIILSMFLFFPNMVGSEYAETVYPSVKTKILRKFCK
ncbi:lipopolysaccharide biosynthesis protein [Hallerella succinigenes]|uniref:O-antigen/teichoic acid export membrane protein n=1 Tax=Hallerella succinigenes TaxID=1896222 RepID=A0A2M9AAU0_9BACT|nr:lipopolysaccharide biosynthesis protein [Hallerella succinigenes]PJJ42835.1 O-antigen/teichoic acid export membrane protein [Hallerella succinigenes]